MSFDFSVVIPTKNRSTYCIKTVKSILSFDGDFEVVICDSSNFEEKNALKNDLNDLKDSRLRYIEVDESFNMTQNFNFSIRTATKSYVVMIGDDDGISPLIFDAVKLCLDNKADSATSDKFYLEYNWPDYQSSRKNARKPGCIYVDESHTISSKVEDLLKGQSSMNKRAGQGCGNLPRAYHGIVSKRLVDELISKHNDCFFGVSPDVSFSMLSACYSKKHLILAFPITISGNGGKSNAGRSAAGTHKGKLDSDPHMKNYKNYWWPETIPYFFSVETVWAQSTLYAQTLINVNKNVLKYDYSQLYSLCLLKHFDMRDAIFKSILVYTANYSMINKILFMFSIFIKSITNVSKKLTSLVSNKFTSSEVVSINAEDIDVASNMLKKVYQK